MGGGFGSFLRSKSWLFSGVIEGQIEGQMGVFEVKNSYFAFYWQKRHSGTFSNKRKVEKIRKKKQNKSKVNKKRERAYKRRKRE